MNLKQTATWIVSVLAVFMATEVGAIDILVWDNDNDVLVRDYVFDNEELTPTESMTRTLDELDLEYTLHRDANLPYNIDDYDLVIICLGFFSDC